MFLQRLKHPVNIGVVYRTGISVFLELKKCFWGEGWFESERRRETHRKLMVDLVDEFVDPPMMKRPMEKVVPCVLNHRTAKTLSQQTRPQHTHTRTQINKHRFSKDYCYLNKALPI